MNENKIIIYKRNLVYKINKALFFANEAYTPGMRQMLE